MNRQSERERERKKRERDSVMSGRHVRQMKNEGVQARLGETQLLPLGYWQQERNPDKEVLGKDSKNKGKAEGCD